MKIITAPIKNPTLFSANIYSKTEIIIIIKDTIPGNKLTIEVLKRIYLY
jgi:hypothetical protein